MRGHVLWGALALLLALSVTASAGASDKANSLYSVDLASGRMSRIGAIGDGTPIVGLAISEAGPSSLYALTADSRLWQFTPFAPSRILAEVEISGLAAGEHLVGIDPESGQAAPIGESFAPIIDGNLLGFDFNPTVDRIRVVDDAGQNLRLNPETVLIGSNPDTGAPTIDGFTAYASTDTSAGARPTLSGAGYTNSVAGAESTQLYVIDTAQDVLAIQDPPNDGVL